MLRVLRRVIDLFNSNLQKNADGLLATKPHKNEDILWTGEKGKRVPENLFALSYKVKKERTICKFPSRYGHSPSLI